MTVFVIVYSREKINCIWLKAKINYFLLIIIIFRLAKLISQVEWSQTGINFIIDSTYYPWIKKEDASTPSPEEDDTSLTMKRFYVSLGQVKYMFSECNNELDLIGINCCNWNPTLSRQLVLWLPLLFKALCTIEGWCVVTQLKQKHCYVMCSATVIQLFSLGTIVREMYMNRQQKWLQTISALLSETNIHTQKELFY